MNDYEDQFAEPAQPLAQPAVQHAEPSLGGSYTRDVNTGELVNNEPAPVGQTEQE